MENFMFTARMFDLMQAKDVRQGDVVQKDGAWMLAVEGGEFVVLSGNNKSILQKLSDEYVMVAKKNGEIEIQFEELLDVTEPVPGKFGMIGFSDNGIRMIARRGGGYALFAMDGSQVEERIHLQATNFAVVLTTRDGKTVRII